MSLCLPFEARAGALWLDLPEHAEPCGFELLAPAFHARVPGTELRLGAHDAGDGDVGVALVRRSERWSLTVRAAGQRELRRELPSPGADCVALAETAALMVERYLDDIRWSGATVVVQPLPPPPPPPRWQLAIELGAGAAIGPVAVGPSLLAGLALRRGAWQAELVGWAMPLTTQLTLSENPSSVPPGTMPSLTTVQMSVQAGGAQLFFGWRRPLPVGALIISAGPGVELLFASTAGGALHSRQSAIAAAPFLGLRAGYEWTFWRRLSVALLVEGRVPLLREELQVDGFGAVLAAPADGDLSLRAGYVFF